MNSISGRKWLLLAFAASTLMLAACDSIKDVKFQPSIPPQPRNHVLRGAVSGLTTKPVVLHYAGPTEDDEKEISVGVNGPFSFSAVPEGSYTITVESNPIGKLCEIENASGTITGTVTDVTVTCAPDPDAPVYKVSGTVVGLAASATALELELDSDAGLETVSVAGGGASFAFTSELLTDFDYAVTIKTAPTTSGTANNCVINAGTGTILDTDITNVQVVCGFSVGGTVTFNGPPTAIGAGLTLALRNTLGTAVATHNYDPSASAFTFAGLLSSTSSANYIVAITAQPAGQACLVRSAGAVSLVTPANVTSVGVVCQALPSVANQLTGTYMSTGRDFVSFFANGTYLYATHSATTGVTGVESGMYSYNCCGPGGTLLTPITTDGNGAANGLSQYIDPTFQWVFANITKATGPPATMTLTINPFTTPVVMNLTAVNSTAGQLQGAWTTADRLRVFAYNSTDNTVIHYGVNNGVANLQDQCMTLGAPVVSGTGSYTPDIGVATCTTIPGGLASVNVDPSGGAAAFPGTNGGFGALPVDYTLTVGAPDSVSLQLTFFGAPFGAPIAFTRSEVN